MWELGDQESDMTERQLGFLSPLCCCVQYPFQLEAVLCMLCDVCFGTALDCCNHCDAYSDSAVKQGYIRGGRRHRRSAFTEMSAVVVLLVAPITIWVTHKNACMMKDC